MVSPRRTGSVCCQSRARSVAHSIQCWSKAQRSSPLSGRRGACRLGFAVCVPPPQTSAAEPGECQGWFCASGRPSAALWQLYCSATADKLERPTVNSVTKRVSDSLASGGLLCLPAQAELRAGTAGGHVPTAPGAALERCDIVHHHSRPVTLECSAVRWVSCQNKQKCLVQESTQRAQRQPGTGAARRGNAWLATPVPWLSLAVPFPVLAVAVTEPSPGWCQMETADTELAIPRAKWKPHSWLSGHGDPTVHIPVGLITGPHHTVRAAVDSWDCL